MNVLGFQKELLAEELRICGLFSPARNSAHNKKNIVARADSLGEVGLLFWLYRYGSYS